MDSGRKEIELYGGGAVVRDYPEDRTRIVVHYTDDITAFSLIKRATIAGKGMVNNEISSFLLERLNAAGIRTYFLRKLSVDSQLCLKTEPIPLEVVVRNVIAGSLADRLGLEEGIHPANVIYDLSYKNDMLGDPLINDHHAVALGLVSYDELKEIYGCAARVNDVLKDIFLKGDIELVDFKVEFGRLPDGTIILAEGITPDNSRLWDLRTKEKLDKDRFRRDLGKVGDAYRTVYQRLVEENA